ncbi:MAG: hypothetical protein DHS20C09_17080 [marine bacterium B5-7]|nr:MAG: hypothetical protein DHS20C09_17080 [marine bacterium B5-7]
MRNSSTNTEFDFNEWAKLAKEDPDAFENKRRQILQNVIDKSSPKIKHRIQGLQWQIDQVRATSPNAMASCLKISQMMWDTAVGEEGLVCHLQRLTDPEHSREISNQTSQSATIMELKDRTNQEKD